MLQPTVVRKRGCQVRLHVLGQEVQAHLAADWAQQQFSTAQLASAQAGPISGVDSAARWTKLRTSTASF